MTKRTSRKSASRSTPVRPAAVAKGKRVLRLPEVIAKVGLSRASIYRLQEAGEFPSSIRIGRSAVAWVEAEVDNWIDARIAERGAAAAAETAHV